MPAALEIRDLRFRYSSRSGDVLHIPQFSVEKGEKIFIFGPSGSGKTTLLSLIGGLFRPNGGTISVLGQMVTSMSQGERDRFRAREIGFVFQVFNLVPYLSTIQNITLPCRFGRRISSGFSAENEEAGYLLEKLGLGALESRDISTLSIGQQQRVAVARALMGSPGLIIADEPTSALDADARSDFLRVLFEQAKREGSTILFVSHDRSLATQFDRSIALDEFNQVNKQSARSYS